MIVPMKGHVVRTVKHTNWYEVTVHVAAYEGIDIEFSDSVDFCTTFDDSIGTDALRLMEKGSKR